MLERIREMFDRLPETEKEMPAVVLDGVPYTWIEVLRIIEEEEPLAEQIQKKVEELYG